MRSWCYCAKGLNYLWFFVGSLSLVFLMSLSGVASAGSIAETESIGNVSQEQTLFYNSQACGSQTGYQLTSTSVRWQRANTSLNAKSPAGGNMGAVLVADCNAVPIGGQSLPFSVAGGQFVSWPANGLVSSTYRVNFSGPYFVAVPNGGSAAGAWVLGEAHGPSGVLGGLCTTPSVFGTVVNCGDGLDG